VGVGDKWLSVHSLELPVMPVYIFSTTGYSPISTGACGRKDSDVILQGLC